MTRHRRGSWVIAHGLWTMRRLLAFAFSLQLFAIMAACSTPGAPAKAAIRNVLLVTVDTLRADHVGAYGWVKARTGALDALARNGALFEHAYAAAPITLTSHATLL